MFTLHKVLQYFWWETLHCPQVIQSISCEVEVRSSKKVWENLQYCIYIEGQSASLSALTKAIMSKTCLIRFWNPRREVLLLGEMLSRAICISSWLLHPSVWTRNSSSVINLRALKFWGNFLRESIFATPPKHDFIIPCVCHQYSNTPNEPHNMCIHQTLIWNLRNSLGEPISHWLRLCRAAGHLSKQ